jgi:hypothetical protein
MSEYDELVIQRGIENRLLARENDQLRAQLATAESELDLALRNLEAAEQRAAEAEEKLRDADAQWWSVRSAEFGALTSERDALRAEVEELRFVHLNAPETEVEKLRVQLHEYKQRARDYAESSDRYQNQLKAGEERAKNKMVELMQLHLDEKNALLADVDGLRTEQARLHGIITDLTSDNIKKHAEVERLRKSADPELTFNIQAVWGLTKKLSAVSEHNDHLWTSLLDAKLWLERMYGIASGNAQVFPNNWTLQALECLRRLDKVLGDKDGSK